jgi:hypothetical protein
LTNGKETIFNPDIGTRTLKVIARADQKVANMRALVIKAVDTVPFIGSCFALRLTIV